MLTAPVAVLLISSTSDPGNVAVNPGAILTAAAITSALSVVNGVGCAPEGPRMVGNVTAMAYTRLIKKPPRRAAYGFY